MQNDTTHYTECCCYAGRYSRCSRNEKAGQFLMHEENQEGLEALNCFHDEYGHFSDDYRTF